MSPQKLEVLAIPPTRLPLKNEARAIRAPGRGCAVLLCTSRLRNLRQTQTRRPRGSDVLPKRCSRAKVKIHLLGASA